MNAAESSELVDQYTALALSIANRWGRNWPWLADDFRSDACLYLWRSALAYNPDRSNGRTFASWARQIIVRALCERLRKERLRNPTAFHSCVRLNDEGELENPIDLIPTSDPDPGSTIDVEALLDTLTPDRREDVVRVVIMDETLEAVAAERGITRSAVGQSVGRSLAKLREAIGET